MAERFPQYLSAPVQVLWFETDELAIIIFFFLLASIFHGFLWIFCIVGPFAYWHRENNDAEEGEINDAENHLLKEFPAEKLSQLGQTTLYFEDLKKYLRTYKIETALAKDLLERLNLIMISQNRIQDHLQKFI